MDSKLKRAWIHIIALGLGLNYYMVSSGKVRHNTKRKKRKLHPFLKGFVKGAVLGIFFMLLITTVTMTLLYSFISAGILQTFCIMVAYTWAFLIIIILLLAKILGFHFKQKRGVKK